MDMGPAQRQPYGRGGHAPRRHRILQQEVRWRPPKCDSRVPGTLVPDGPAPRTQESHPSTLGGLSAHNDRFKLHSPLDATPLGGHRLTSGPSTVTTRTPSVSGVIGWVLAERGASPNVGALTCSICVRVALRRVVPCAAPEALGGPWSPGTRPLCTPSGGGRSTGCTATARAHEDPAPGAELPREAFTAPLRAPRGAPRGRTKTTNPPGTYGTSTRRTPRGCGPLVRPVAVAHAHEDLTPGTAPREASASPHTVRHGARAPNPPAPLGARLSARREPRGLRTTARPVAPTRARGALVSVSLARLGHEKVSSNVRHVRGRSRKSRSLESGTVQKFRISQAVSIPSPRSLFSSLGDLSKPPVFF